MNPLINSLSLAIKKAHMIGCYGGKVNKTLFNYRVKK